MSSALQSVLTGLQQYDYVSLALLTAVVYDYVLTFSDEIEYIWIKPWTWVSTLFILARYAGLCTFIIQCLRASFISGPEKTVVSTVIQIFPRPFHSRTLSKGEITYIVIFWTFLLFLGAADFVMTLRVWAMYDRSKLILNTLLISFSLEIISTLLAAAIYSNPRNISVGIIWILDSSFCVWKAQASPIWLMVATILQMTHGAAMFVLAIVQFARQSLQMYRVTKDWQLNRYMNLLIKHGILYFLFIFLYWLIQVLGLSGRLPTVGWQPDLLVILGYVPMYTLTPRFILSLRELYACDVQHRRGEGIDTAFGLSSFGSGAVGTAMAFADVELNEVVGVVEEVAVTRDIRTTRPE